jgi:hypothetical protein
MLSIPVVQRRMGLSVTDEQKNDRKSEVKSGMIEPQSTTAAPVRPNEDASPAGD